MKFVIDTSAYSGSERDDPKVRPWFTPAHQLYVPLIVIAELRAGFMNGSHEQANEILLEEFLASRYTVILPLTEETTRLYGKMYVALCKIGRPINTNDMWIAALCLEHKLPLLTLDQDFQHIKGLKLL